MGGRAVVLRLVGPSVVYEPRPRTIPLIWAPALAPGSPLGADRELFPRVWPPPPDPWPAAGPRRTEHGQGRL